MAENRLLLRKARMQTSMEPELDTRGVVPIENPQKSSHGSPPEGCHGLCLPNPCRAAYLGGVSSGKTNCLICTLVTVVTHLAVATTVARLSRT